MHAVAVFRYLCIVVLFFACLAKDAKESVERRGVLLLDAFTFPKIVPNKEHDVFVLVSLKSQFAEYATASIREDYFSFAKKVQTQGEADNVIFAQVIVNGAENKKIATEIGIDEDFLHPRLFIYSAGAKDAVPYPDTEPFHLNKLTEFAKLHSTVQYQLPGTLQTFDLIARKFFDADAVRQKAIILNAEALLDTLEDEQDKHSAHYYVKLMKKVSENGKDYIAREISRQKKVLDDASKLNKGSRRAIEHHMNVLHHFMQLSIQPKQRQEEEPEL